MSVKCDQCQELLSPYLDGALTETLRKELENHLRGCSFCREELEALRRTVELLHAWSEEEMELPEGFEERLRSRLTEASRPWYRQLTKSWVSLSVAAVILIAMVVSSYPWISSMLLTSSPQQVRQDKAMSPAPALKSEAKTTEAQVQEMVKVEADKVKPESMPPAGQAGDVPGAAPELKITEQAAQAFPPLINGREKSLNGSGGGSDLSRDANIKAPSNFQARSMPAEEESGVEVQATLPEGDAGEFKAPKMGLGGGSPGEPSGETVTGQVYGGFPPIIWGKDLVLPEVAAWAEENKNVEGVVKTKFNFRDIYLVSMGERPGGGYEVKFDKLTFDAEGNLVVDVIFVEPDQEEPVSNTYPYDVFTVPEDYPVKVMATDKNGTRELPVREILPLQ